MGPLISWRMRTGFDDFGIDSGVLNLLLVIFFGSIWSACAGRGKGNKWASAWNRTRRLTECNYSARGDKNRWGTPKGVACCTLRK